MMAFLADAAVPAMDAGALWVQALASPVGLGLFAYLVWRSVERLGGKIDAMTAAMGKLASRIDVASGMARTDPTPRPFVIRPPTGNGDG